MIIVAVLIAAAVINGFMPKPVPVETAPVVRAPLMVTVEEEGKTRVMDRFVLSAPVTGTVLRTVLNVGDTVTKGQTILEIEPRMSAVLDPRTRAEAAARVEAARASLNAAREDSKAAKAEASYSVSELGRIKKLHSDGYTTEERLEKSIADERRSRATLRSAQFAVTVASYELDAAKTTLKYSGTEPAKRGNGPVKLKAPVDGRVLKILHKSEGAVVAGEDLMELGDPGALEVEVDVRSEHAVQITRGTKLLLERWGGEQALKGVVRVVEPAGFTKISALGVEEQRVLVIADITSPRAEWTRLGDGYRVEASFILWQSDTVLQVPSSATFTHNGSRAVFVYKDSTAVLSKVTLGHSSGIMTEVLSGLTEGEVVITHPDDEVENGTKVRAIE
ncbi:MAG: HlyD family efflux transporter periplasmic adaptor subunit [Proteobacteria bacterium]|nr:HlyD family efflux transporter periplasmic adaptor subunit [Pseudomonadota bacterium]